MEVLLCQRGYRIRIGGPAYLPSFHFLIDVITRVNINHILFAPTFFILLVGVAHILAALCYRCAIVACNVILQN